MGCPLGCDSSCVIVREGYVLSQRCWEARIALCAFDAAAAAMLLMFVSRCWYVFRGWRRDAV
jgi:hypothetical protein